MPKKSNFLAYKGKFIEPHPSTKAHRGKTFKRNDYYPFGMQMPGRKYAQANTNYRYGFNGKENDNDVKGEGNQQDYGMRIYDTRLGKFLSVDPLTKQYSMLTPYQFASNSPIQNIDIDGLEGDAANGAMTNTETSWNLGFLKAKKENYGNGSYLGWLGISKQSTFAKNAITSGYNQTISAIEDIPTSLHIVKNVFSNEGRQENKVVGLNMFLSAIRWWNSEPYKKVDTYEDIAGSLIIGMGMDAANPFARGNSYLNLLQKEKVPITIAKTQDDIRFMKAMNQEAGYMPSENGKGYIMLTGRSRIQLIEEGIHYKQYKKYGFDYAQKNRNLLEFEAQIELLNIGKKEGWNKTQMSKIKNAAKTWGKKALEDINKQLSN